MDLQKFHTFTDEIFDLDKSTGELGKKLSELKDHFSSLHKEFTEKDSQIQALTEEKNLLASQKEKLVLANGELLMRTPVKVDQVHVNNPYDEQKEEPSGIEQLLGGIKI